MFSQLSVRHKFLVSTVGIVVLVAAFTAIYYPALLQQRTMDGRRDQVVHLAETVALGVGIGLGLSELSVVATTFEWARRDKALLYVYVSDNDGIELGGYSPTGIPAADHGDWDGLRPSVLEIGDGFTSRSSCPTRVGAWGTCISACRWPISGVESRLIGGPD